MNPDADNIDRDRRLRFRILRLLNVARRSSMPIRAYVIRDQIKRLDLDQFEDDGHLISLLTDLAGAGLIVIKDTRRLEAQRLSPDYIDCSITAKGTRFLAGGEPPDALIADGRIVRES